MRFPRTLFELEERFPDEEACIAFLRRARWPRGFRCPRCGARESYHWRHASSSNAPAAATRPR